MNLLFTTIVAVILVSYVTADTADCVTDGLELVLTPGQMTQIGGVPLEMGIGYLTLTFDDQPRIVNYPPFRTGNCSADEDLIQEISLSPDLPTGPGKLTFGSTNVTCYNVLVIPSVLPARVAENRVISVCKTRKKSASGISRSHLMSTTETLSGNGIGFGQSITVTEGPFPITTASGSPSTPSGSFDGGWASTIIDSTYTGSFIAPTSSLFSLQPLTHDGSSAATTIQYSGRSAETEGILPSGTQTQTISIDSTATMDSGTTSMTCRCPEP
ncbi:hypothetical protein OAory_01095540 [Aspergillus oryzae]|uniref:GPI anchored cell wall protein n=1 Tax=Aspergillus oryzae TaxID=5062 RepID=A0A1S9D4A2_ASPOZ|nr:hypothetical protein OAory_01095540 [Aspergillus oryzae]